ncbi:MAG: hypothetical protein WA231_14720 [Methylocella sp.]
MQNNHSHGSCASFARPRVNKFAGGAMVAVMLTSPAFADTVTNLAYPSLPTSWSFFNGSAGTSPTVAPDGTMTGVVVDASGTGGGIMSGAKFPVTAGTVYTSSKYLRVSNGDPNLQVCIGKSAFGKRDPRHCLTFNGLTGAFISLDPLLADYAIAPIAQTGWWRASVTFKPTSTANANLGDFSATTGIFEVWGEQLETGQYQSKLVPTTDGPASAVNQLNPNADSANGLWTATNGGASQVTGRAGGPLPAWKFVPGSGSEINGISTTIVASSDAAPVYYYFYVGNSSNFTMNINQYITNAICNATINYMGGQIYAQNIPVSPEGNSPFTYGEFNAGEFEVVWVALACPLSPPYNQISMSATLGAAYVQNITLGRVGIQTGLFP